MGLSNHNPSDAWEGNALLAEDWAGADVIGWSVEYGGGPASFPSVLLADGAVIEGFKVRVFVGSEEEAVRWSSS